MHDSANGWLSCGYGQKQSKAQHNMCCAATVLHIKPFGGEPFFKLMMAEMLPIFNMVWLPRILQNHVGRVRGGVSSKFTAYR